MQRCDLIAALNAADELSLPVVVKAMVESERVWDAVASFYEEVMYAKEAAEREREAITSLPMRSRRTRRRRPFNDLRPP